MKRLLIISLLFTFNPSFAKEFTIKSDPWCPFSCEAGNKDRRGYIVEILDLVMKEHGISVRYENLNWARAVAETSQGKNDALAGCGPDEGDFLIPDKPLASARFTFWSLKTEKEALKSWKLAPDLSIGVITGYTYDTEVQTSIDEGSKKFLKVSGDDPLLNLLELLQKGRIKYIYEEEHVFAEYIKSHPQFKIDDFTKKLSLPKATQDLYACFSKKNSESAQYVKLINESLKKPKFKKAIQQLKKKYGI